MNRTLALSTAGLAALALVACQKKPANTAAENAVNAPVSATQDAVGAAVGQTSASTLGSNDTGAFVSNASQSDMYEMEAAKIAQARSKNTDVKAFAKQMLADHTKMMSDMKPLVAAAGQKPADGLDQRRQGFLDNLKTASDADFDKTYIGQQVAAHNEALTLMQGYADGGGDAGLKAGAAKAVPMIQGHLAKARSIEAAMK